tara:strand:+ start:170 stop:352 length:183 start_codon:yes stop_codon:yes gene_type:complete
MKNQKTTRQALEEWLGELEEEYQEVWDSVYGVGGEGLKSDLSEMGYTLNKVQEILNNTKE